MLPRLYKLKKENDIKNVFKKGKFYQTDFLKLKIVKNDLNFSRFALIVSLKVSKKAVVRNKIKRRLEETIRLKLNQIKTGFDIIILINPEIVEKNYLIIQEVLINLFKKSELIS